MGAFTSEAVRQHCPSFWMPLAHAAAIRCHSDLSLVALVDSDPEALARAATEYGVARTFADHRAMLEALAPELVTLATRTVGRADMIADCLAAGVRALHVEKPLCNSVRELEMLERLLDAGDYFMTLGAVRRFLPPYIEAVREAHAERSGKLVEARISVGAAPLYWTHPHSIDLLLFAAGGRKVEAVSARLSSFSAEGSVVVDDPIIDGATIWFEGGFAGHIGRALGSDFHVASQFGEYSVINDGAALTTVRFEEGYPYPVTHPLPMPQAEGPGGSAAPIGHLIACLAGDPEEMRANAALRRDILLGQRILFAMVQSHFEGGCPVAPDAIDPNLVIHGITGGRYA